MIILIHRNLYFRERKHFRKIVKKTQNLDVQAYFF